VAARDAKRQLATTDAICGSLVGPLLVKCPALGGQMRIWARDRNMWVRRAAAAERVAELSARPRRTLRTRRNNLVF
jgi:hypothetical protein